MKKKVQARNSRGVVVRELKRIARANDGLLVPELIVEHARPRKSPLHRFFVWDDTDAAALYRVWQARQMLRTSVIFAEINGDRRPIRVFVSLKSDREQEAGGYREVVVVLNDPDLRQQMLKDALEELRTFELKYAHLKELAKIFAASKKARAAINKEWR